MIRKKAMEIVLEGIKNEPIIAANGFLSRELFALRDKETNFYMIGSMGLSSSIGLGVAIKNPHMKIFVFDGDGNILMNLGSIVTIGAVQPKNFVHIIFDNASHESTGGQPTNSNNISLSNFGKDANYKVFLIKNQTNLKKIMHKIMKIEGPIMLVIKIKKNNTKSDRVSIFPEIIKNRFMKSLKEI